MSCKVKIASNPMYLGAMRPTTSSKKKTAETPINPCYDPLKKVKLALNFRG